MLKFFNFYQFFLVQNPSDLRDQMRCLLNRYPDILGSILISHEGVNFNLAGSSESVAHMQDEWSSLLETLSHFSKEACLAHLHHRTVSIDAMPFRKKIIKIKKEIIRMNVDSIKPAIRTAPYIHSLDLCRWIESGKPLVILDVRNDYELKEGMFNHSLHLSIRHFSEFTQALHHMPAELKQKPIVSVCTGGIRCEKASAYMLDQGFEQVFQLKDGILDYFKHCGNRYYTGGCFVFDDRQCVYPPQYH